MKTLSFLFAIIGILFLLLGLAFLTINEPTTTTEKLFFSCFFGGMLSTTCFLITDKLINSKN